MVYTPEGTQVLTHAVTQTALGTGAVYVGRIEPLFIFAVPGHWLIGYIHPYMDGNGRMARFLMNAMLASGGYPWTVVRVEDRARYLCPLDSASIDHDIAPGSRQWQQSCF